MLIDEFSTSNLINNSVLNTKLETIATKTELKLEQGETSSVWFELFLW